MSAQHTPAPWEAKGDWVYARNGMTPIADCDVGARARKEREADARLIAAAPVLLAALKDVTDALERHVDIGTQYRPSPYEHPLNAYDRARAAIAKATA